MAPLLLAFIGALLTSARHIFQNNEEKMGPTARLIQNCSRNGNPLCGTIQWPEEENLIEDLRKRLNLTQKELNELPASLKRLETALIEYSKRENKLEDKELRRLIREVTIYVGKVLILHCGGKWFTDLRNLNSSEIEIVSEEHVKNSNGKFSIPFGYLIGMSVAWSWDEINYGNLPGLYKLYQSAHRKYRIGVKYTSE